jgi:hypothetical protein
MYTDSDGDMPHILVGALVGAICGAVAYVFSVLVTGNEFNFGEFAIETLSGAAYGALICSGIGAIYIALGKVALATVTSIAHSINDELSFMNTMSNAATSLLVTAAFQAVFWFLPKPPVKMDEFWQRIDFFQSIGIKKFAGGVLREVFMDND